MSHHHLQRGVFKKVSRFEFEFEFNMFLNTKKNNKKSAKLFSHDCICLDWYRYKCQIIINFVSFDLPVYKTKPFGCSVLNSNSKEPFKPVYHLRNCANEFCDPSNRKASHGLNVANIFNVINKMAAAFTYRQLCVNRRTVFNMGFWHLFELINCLLFCLLSVTYLLLLMLLLLLRLLQLPPPPPPPLLFCWLILLLQPLLMLQ